MNPLIAIGSLEINEPEETIKEYLRKHPEWDTCSGVSVRSLLSHRYGISNYSDCDINGNADVNVDLNKPLPINLKNSAMTVLNGGTIEHIFDTAQAFTNFHDMASINGTIIHLSPITWYEHGFYNLNPLVFEKIAEVNGYSLIAEAFWFSNIQPPKMESRYKGISPENLIITYDGQELIQNRQIVSDLFNQYLLPSKALYLVAYQKRQNKKFVTPYCI